LHSGKFVFEHTEDNFNHETYVSFLEDFVLPVYYRLGHRIFLIHDNASYHKKPETIEWFDEHAAYIVPYNLPAYAPQLNAIERIWHYVRMHSTHNRYFATKDELCETLFSAFAAIQDDPNCIMAHLEMFF
jgi:hypothetical protein